MKPHTSAASLMLLMAGSITLFTLSQTTAHALPSGYNRNLARQQLANAAATARARGLVSLKGVQSMGLRLATSDRFVDDHVAELQREGTELGTARIGTNGPAVLDAILAAQSAVSARRGTGATLGGTQTGKPAETGPASRDSINGLVSDAQTSISAARGTTATSLTPVSGTTKTPGRDSSMISSVDDPGFWDWVRTGGDSKEMEKEWNQKYGSKPACGDGGDPMCGYQFTAGGASIPNPEGGTRPKPGTLTATPGSLSNPRQGSHVTNPSPDSTTGTTAGIDRTAPIPGVVGGGVVNPGNAGTVRPKLDPNTTPPSITNTNLINPDRSNGAPTEPGSKTGSGAQGSVGTPTGGKSNE